MFGAVQFVGLSILLLVRGTPGRLGMLLLPIGTVVGALAVLVEGDRSLRRIGVLVVVAWAAVFALIMILGSMLPE
jgi:hypothetical protein